MILSHEPTETGKKRRELGIDGQCISILYMIQILNKPVVSYVVDFVTGTVVNQGTISKIFLGSSVAERLGQSPDLKSRGRGFKFRSDQLARFVSCQTLVYSSATLVNGQLVCIAPFEIFKAIMFVSFSLSDMPVNSELGVARRRIAHTINSNNKHFFN